MCFTQAIKWGRLPAEERALLQAERQVSAAYCIVVCISSELEVLHSDDMEVIMHIARITSKLHAVNTTNIII